MGKKLGGKAVYVVAALWGCWLFNAVPVMAVGVLNDYAKSPAFVTDPIQPLTMLLLDNTGSMGSDAYTGTYDATKNYYGLYETRTNPTGAADIYYYHPFALASGNVCTYTTTKGSCSKSSGAGVCNYIEKNCTGTFDYYTCYRAAGVSGNYPTNTCDGPDSGTTSDCPGGSDNCAASGYTCRSTMTVSSTYQNSNCDNSCSGGATCVQDYSCYSGSNRDGNYGNNTCDGTDTDTASDCQSGYTCGARTGRYVCYKPAGDSGSYTSSSCSGVCSSSSGSNPRCVVASYGCQVTASGDGLKYDNATCDSADSGSTTNCETGFSCISAYHCVNSSNQPGSPDTIYGTTNCDNRCGNNGRPPLCRAVSGAGTQDWTGKTCSSCPGGVSNCIPTGNIVAVPDNNCTTGSTATCDSAVGGSCATGSLNCDWQDDYVGKVDCESTYGPAGGGTCSYDAAYSGQTLTRTCATSADQYDCDHIYNLYNATSPSHCAAPAVAVTTTSRAPYWRKTPTAPPGGSYTDSGGKVTLGNRLNFDQMTQMDVAKKVLIGGKTTTTSISGAVELDGDFNQNNSYYTCTAPAVKVGGEVSSASGIGGCTNYQGVNNNGNIVMQGSSDTYPDPAPHGVVQDFSTLAWGFAVLNNNNLGGSGTPNGGIVMNPVGDTTSSIIQNINDTRSSGMTDLAEALNTVVNYFRQSTPEYPGYYTCSPGGGSYTNATCDGSDTGTTTDCVAGATCVSVEYQVNTAWDPFYDDNSSSYASCGRASTIVITDGEPNQDETFNSTIAHYADNATGITNFKVADGSQNYRLDDVSYWAHTNDLRPGVTLTGDQKLDLYYIYAFGNSATMQANMQKTAVLGGFIDNGANLPTILPNIPSVEAGATDSMREWDWDKDTIADNYADASEGSALAVKLQGMLGEIQTRGASGSASSVISASRSGEGAIYQAVFFPRSTPDSGGRSLAWSGDVHAMWLDDRGNIREDCLESQTDISCSAGDGIYTPKADKIITFSTDPTSGEALITTYRDTNGDNIPESAIGTDFMKDFNNYLWSGASWLARIDPADVGSQRVYDSPVNKRYIFTQNDSSGTPVKVGFTPTVMAGITGFDTNYASYLNAASTTEADKIVRFIRGEEILNYRSRTYGPSDLVYKLGDIVGSTPTLVSKPAEAYDSVYLDPDYHDFRNRYDKRRIMVYAGGNDGGLHAFNGGYYDRVLNKFLPAPPVSPYTRDALTNEYANLSTQYALGSEMWMFIPKNLLPHLKWLTDPNYGATSRNHVYYVDQRPYIFDAKIFDPTDGIHTGGWGTLLVGGMGFGGGDITPTVGGPTFRSAYFILDITDPEREPVVLAEFTDPSLGFTTSFPTGVPILTCDRKTNQGADCTAKDWSMRWYLAFGSGPHNSSLPATALVGKSDQSAKVFVLDLGGTDAVAISGSTVQRVPTLFKTLTIPGSTVMAKPFTNSYFSDFIAVDHDLDFKTDVLYFGSVANTNIIPRNYTGGVHRLVTQESTTAADWSINTFFNAGRPVTAAPTVGTDGKRLWVYFGTGRLMDSDDKNDSSLQTYYGLKESYDVDDVLQLGTPNAGNLTDVTHVGVRLASAADLLSGVPVGQLINNSTGAPTSVSSTGAISGTPAASTLSAQTFKALNLEMSEKLSGLDRYNGWKIDLTRAKERNLGQASLLGGALTFATYRPTGDACTAEGESYLWAAYYRTGTSYTKSIIGIRSVGTVTETSRDISLGSGMALTPSVHVGSEQGSKAFVQTSSGAIIGTEVANPGATKSGVISWRDKDPD